MQGRRAAAIKGVRYLSDEEGRKTAVVIDLRRHRQIWEDMYDVMIAETRKDETRVSWEAVKRRMKTKRARRA